MKTEYEVKVLEINVDEICKKLEDMNAVLIGSYLQRRYTYNFNPVQEKKWIRLRTNGETTTLCIKEVTAMTIDGTKELEVEVSDFDTTRDILEQLGYNPKNYQETKRITYKLDNIEIDIDTWPLIPSFMEIEGPDTESVTKMLDRLDVSEDKVSTLDVQGIFNEKYGIEIDPIKELKFND